MLCYPQQLVLNHCAAFCNIETNIPNIKKKIKRAGSWTIRWL